MTDKDKDDLVFTAYYINAEQFKRHFHTLESYARRAKYKEVCHKLESGEILRNTRLDIQGS
ncbi:unnamed protein product [marine sediment metagenome]|uniref:Uncharacterized protein n=1 Tax=marine sediment metagenome TaxID=412755 RepID=X1J5I0_9ZZZZ